MPIQTLSRRRLLALAVTPLVVSRLPGNAPSRKLFCMDTAMVRDFGTLLARKNLEDLVRRGYSGVGPLAADSASWRHLVDHVIPWATELKLELPAVYSWVHVSRSGAELDPGIAQYVPKLAATRTAIWLPISSKVLPASSTEADASLVVVIREAADLAKRYDCSVSLYPHYGSVLQTIPDALRLLRQVSRSNAGLTFNLCHWLRSEPDASLAQTIEDAKAYLRTVTVCGADRHGRNWKELIQPLDQGDFPLQTLISELDRQGFKGPIGLQGYDVAKNFNIPPEANLVRSIAAWRKMTA